MPRPSVGGYSSETFIGNELRSFCFLFYIYGITENTVVTTIASTTTAIITPEMILWFFFLLNISKKFMSILLYTFL